MDNPLIFACIRDTHSHFIDFPEGDVFIHCGDFSKHGEEKQVKVFIEWLTSLPFNYKAVIAGNHDIFLDTEKYENMLKQRFHNKYNRRIFQVNAILIQFLFQFILIHGVVIEGYKIWGSPYSPTIPNYPWAFQVDPEECKEFGKQWRKDLILLQHMEPHSLGHSSYRSSFAPTEEEWEEEALANRIKEVKPLYHIFGHVHERYGVTQENGTKYVNFGIIDERYTLAEKDYIFSFTQKSSIREGKLKQYI